MFNTRQDCIFRFRNNHSVDVFIGNGWDNHFHFVREKHLWKVEHDHLPADIFKSVTNSLNRIAVAKNRYHRKDK